MAPSRPTAPKPSGKTDKPSKPADLKPGELAKEVLAQTLAPEVKASEKEVRDGLVEKPKAEKTDAEPNPKDLPHDGDSLEAGLLTSSWRRISCL